MGLTPGLSMVWSFLQLALNIRRKRTRVKIKARGIGAGSICSNSRGTTVSKAHSRAEKVLDFSGSILYTRSRHDSGKSLPPVADFGHAGWSILHRITRTREATTVGGAGGTAGVLPATPSLGLGVLERRTIDSDEDRAQDRDKSVDSQTRPNTTTPGTLVVASCGAKENGHEHAHFTTRWGRTRRSSFGRATARSEAG